MSGAVYALKMYQNVALHTCFYFLQGTQDIYLNLDIQLRPGKSPCQRLAQSVADMFLPRDIQVSAQPSHPSVGQQPRVQAEQPGPGGRWTSMAPGLPPKGRWREYTERIWGPVRLEKTLRGC